MPVTQLVWTWFLHRISGVRNADIPGWVWVVLLWALMAFPAASLRGAHYEEGTVIGLARGAVEDGHWLAPYLYGGRFIERPVLLSWIAAAIGELTGGVTIWSVRIPHLLFLLAGGLMVFDLVRAHTRQAPAVFGALCWFACPMVAQKFVTAEPDVTLSVLLFGGFFLWWKGVAAGHVTMWRWLSIGIVLTAAGLTKGLQPLAFFGLGVGACILVKRRWRDIPGFVMANLAAALAVASWYWAVMRPGDIEGWIYHSRLSDHMTAMQWISDHLDFALSLAAVEWLPGSLLLIPAIGAIAAGNLGRERDLMLAAVLYALSTTMILLVWPGGIATRYAMPANLALALLGGILFDRWWDSRPWLIAVSNTVVTGISAALIVLGWIVMPMLPDAFGQSRIAAQTIAAVRKMVPGTVYYSPLAVNYNVVAHVPGPVRDFGLLNLKTLKIPVLALLSEAEISSLEGEAPDVRAIPHAVLNNDPPARIVEIRPNP